MSKIVVYFCVWLDVWGGGGGMSFGLHVRKKGGECFPKQLEWISNRLSKSTAKSLNLNIT